MVVGPAAEIGDVLVEDERVKLITFTGSGDVGWKLQERAPRKRVQLELGNSTPVIVAADADVETAAPKLAANAFSFAGQSCISVQRIYVERPRVRRVRRGASCRRSKRSNVGDPADDDTDVGPVIDEDARTRILEWIDEARAVAPRSSPAASEQDGLIQPTVIAEGAADAEGELRGGLRAGRDVNAVDSLDEAIELANGTRFGLQAGIFTAASTRRCAPRSELEFGGVIVNEAPTFRTDQMPYGGVKDSGNTREGPACAVREMTEERLVVIQL